MKLSIIVPAFNEERRILPALHAYTEYFVPRYGGDVEFIVVINGSTDRTEAVVQEFSLGHAQVRAIVESRRIGKGGALMLGLKAAAGDRVGFTDADGSTPPVAFDALVRECESAGCAIASRWAKGSEVRPRQPLSRRIASRIFNFMVNRLFRLRLSDTQCGAKVMTRAAVEDVLPALGVTKWAFDVDLLFQLRRAGHRIVEIPTVWHDVKGSKVNVPLASAQMALAITRLRLLYSPLVWVVRIYDRLVAGGRVLRGLGRRSDPRRRPGPGRKGEWT